MLLKKMILLLIVLVPVSINTLFVRAPDPPIVTPDASTEAADVGLPDAKSHELDLYVHEDTLFGSDGTAKAGFVLDSEGNILGSNGEIVVAAANVEPFTCVTKATVLASQTNKTLPGYRLDDNTTAALPTTFEVDLTIAPGDAVNTGITIESSDPEALFIPFDVNNNLISDAQMPLINAMSSIAISKAGQTLKLWLTACSAGNYEIVIRNILDQIIGTVRFTFEIELPDLVPTAVTAPDAKPHEHSYQDTVVQPTYKSGGYTLHTCSACGHTYKDSFTDPVPCTHDYSVKVIEPTYSEGGYSIYTCKICGDTKRDNYTQKKTCTHFWNAGKVTVAATCTREGVKTYTCLTCGATKTEPIPKTAHTMASQVIAPTQNSQGYTRHYCTVCGYEGEHTDITEALPHEHSYTSTVTPPTCTSGGYTTHTCSSCGHSYTDSETPALGHSYTDTVVQPTCETGGYTIHACNRCGYSYTDSETSALGHDWVEHTERIRVGQEQHTFCGACGMDFDANGTFDNGTISNHMKAHVLNGESGRTYSAMVDIYDTVTTWTCSRCGATK